MVQLIYIQLFFTDKPHINNISRKKNRFNDVLMNDNCSFVCGFCFFNPTSICNKTISYNWQKQNSIVFGHAALLMKWSPHQILSLGKYFKLNGVELTNHFLRCCACLWYCAMWLHSTLFISECIMHFTSLNILSHLASLQFTASNHECHYYSSIKCLQLGVSWRTEECGWLQHFPFVHCWSSRPQVELTPVS